MFETLPAAIVGHEGIFDEWKDALKVVLNAKTVDDYETALHRLDDLGRENRRVISGLNLLKNIAVSDKFSELVRKELSGSQGVAVQAPETDFRNRGRIRFNATLSDEGSTVLPE